MQVCVLLSNPDSNGIQTCLQWADITTTYLLPPLSITESITLGSGFWLILLVAWGFKQLSYRLR